MHTRFKLRNLRTLLLPLISLAFCGVIVCSTATPEAAHRDLLPYARFIAGCSLIKSSPVMQHPKQAAALYRDLVKVTGLQAGDVVTFLGRVRKDPDQIKALHTLMQQAFTERSDSTGNPL